MGPDCSISPGLARAELVGNVVLLQDADSFVKGRAQFQSGLLSSGRACEAVSQPTPSLHLG